MLSARNQIEGKVKGSTPDRVVSKATVEAAAGVLVSILSTRTVVSLKEGDDVLVLVKATEAMIEKP